MHYKSKAMHFELFIFVLLCCRSIESNFLLFERLDDIEDDDDVDGDNGEDGGGDGGHRGLVLEVLQHLLGAKEDSDREEEHEAAVDEEPQQSLVGSLGVGSSLEISFPGLIDGFHRSILGLLGTFLGHLLLQ